MHSHTQQRYYKYEIMHPSVFGKRGILRDVTWTSHTHRLLRSHHLLWNTHTLKSVRIVCAASLPFTFSLSPLSALILHLIDTGSQMLNTAVNFSTTNSDIFPPQFSANLNSYFASDHKTALKFVWIWLEAFLKTFKNYMKRQQRCF